MQHVKEWDHFKKGQKFEHVKKQANELEKVHGWILDILEEDNPNINEECKKYLLKKLMQKYAHIARIPTTTHLWELT